MSRLSQNHMREYETLYILQPDITDEDAVTYIQKMKALVEANGGKHIKATNQGRRKLAWERLRQQKGMFVSHVYLGKPGIVLEYERQLGIDEDVMLRQTTVVSKAVDAEAREVEEDQLEPPAPKERREEEEREYRGDRDRDRDRGDRDRGGRDRDDRGDRDRGGRDRDD